MNLCIPFKCADCGVCTLHGDEYYMVHNDVWAKAGMAPDGGMLCIGDLERRLGRTLTPEDFTDAPVNAITGNGLGDKSDRLLDRLAR